MNIEKVIVEFFNDPPKECGVISNERALQLELAYFLRSKGYKCTFEKNLPLPRPPLSTVKPKSWLDLLVSDGEKQTAIELKVPLNGQHPETIYSFCMDIEFVEAILRNKNAHFGLCVFLTNDPVFWTDSGRGSEIHNFFREKGNKISGEIQKPTGTKETSVYIQGNYETWNKWQNFHDEKIMKNAQYLILPINL